MMKITYFGTNKLFNREMTENKIRQ